MESNSPFRFIKNIQHGIPLTPDEVREFNPYLMTRMYYYTGYDKLANFLNIMWPLDKEIQFRIFSVLFRGVYPRGWIKSAKDKYKDGIEVEYMKRKYGVSTKIAREYAELLTSKERKEIKKVFE
jgi:hypothetical protein